MFKRFIAIVIVLVLFTTTLTPIANAKQIENRGQKLSQELTKTEEKEAQQLADELEYIFEEASIKDENGNLIGFQEDKLVERFGESEDLKEFMELSKVLTQEPNNILTQEPNNNGITLLSRQDDVNTCFNKKVKNEYKSVVSGAIIDEIWVAVITGAYLTAAKKLVKLGIKGTAVGIGVTLMNMLYSCTKNPYQ
ncbi:hypothetical protein [Peribacillus frigoritolerans]|uniref:hypothetical protein n=1 Tax=Peribacillus frigoritolerans TaxID=450367 RepID=UPI00227FC1A1|nr:hypothetical protein [Peribacillus frigoritolerans]MCY9138384.1 hypothetical protein [Peribacillus frigoritolerans]